MKAVEIIDNRDGTFSVRVYSLIVFTGTYEQCARRAEQE